MGALEMGLSEEELKPLVTEWRAANTNITQFWWDVDKAVIEAVGQKAIRKTHGLTFQCTHGMLFVTLPSGRRLAYVKPKLGENQFGGTSVTYEGVGVNKRWERIESYGPKFVENIVQATARDLLAHAMQNLKHKEIVMHIHDEIVIEAPIKLSVEEVCKRMSQAPTWAKGLLLNADGYECEFYQKE